MPASRRARAMIFAPRSCPSSPGLAITTRILPTISPTLEDRRLAPGAPDLAERVAHLAQRRVRSRRLDDRRHQVHVAFSRPLERGQSLVDRAGVSPRPQRLHARGLLLLECRVDAQDLERPLVLLRVAVDADDDPLG